VALEFDGTLSLEDDANAYLGCGYFVVIGEIDLREGFQYKVSCLEGTVLNAGMHDKKARRDNQRGWQH
jgi:hypothetical protein